MTKVTTCYLNKLGIINTLGANALEVARNLLGNTRNPPVTPVTYDELFSGRKTVIGKVTQQLLDIPKNLNQFNCRNNQLLFSAYADIADDIELLKYKYGTHRIGVVLGTSTSGIASGEAAFQEYLVNHKYPNSFDYQQQAIGSCAEFLAQYAGTHGINYTISTACSSSGKAIAAAYRLLLTDQCDAVIAGGSDSLCKLTLNGFDSLELLSSSICNPFSKNRNGLHIGEGAALFILSKEPSPIKLIGMGEASDGYHMTAPDPNGGGAKLAITKALKSAKLKAQDIGYINLHGTGTKKNDAMEALVISELFDNALCSSTKPLTGHTLGASGAQELGLCWLLLSETYNPQKILPSHIWDEEQDPELPKINLISEPCLWQQPIFMSNSFAFGGSNISLIIAND